MNPISSSNESNEADVKEYKSECSGEPSPKKPKLMLSEKDTSTMEKLENRLGSILRCVVCFDLPNTAIFQVLLLFEVPLLIETSFSEFFMKH